MDEIQRDTMSVGAMVSRPGNIGHYSYGGVAWVDQDVAYSDLVDLVAQAGLEIRIE